MTITVTREGDRWVARFPWSVEAKDIVKAAGFRFDPPRKLWWTDRPEIAAKLSGDTSALAEAVRSAAEAREASVLASRATDAQIEIPLSEAARARGMGYFPFQRAGVAFCLSREAALLADEMGVGKTIQALGVINADASIRNVLVICPASLKLNWLREARLWLAREMPVALVNGTLPAGGFCVTNYDMIAKQRAWIDSVEWDLLISDEAHFLKNDKAQRTRAVLGKWDRDEAKRVAPIRARRKLFLTGTPVLNRPVELWPLLHALDREGLGRNWQAFVTRYCAGHKKPAGWRGPLVWDVSGASNLAELQAKLRASIMIRRLKADVLTELPAKRRQIIALQPQTARARKAVEDEARLTRETEAKLAALRAAVEALDPETAQDRYEAAALALREAEKVAFAETSLVRHEVELAKLPQVIEHLSDLLDGSDQKLVVFAHHHDVLDELHAALAAFGALKADGRDSVPARDERVQRFQSDPAARVIVCGITAMGVGHTLTAASHVVFASLDWTPGNLLQAEDRCHRIGQRDSVLVQHIVLDGSLDARMTELIVGKMGVIADALDTAPAARMPLRSPAEPASEQKPVSATGMPSEVKDAVRASLRLLAGVCDGAFARDDVGFNGRDARFGHSLAGQERLSDRQAEVALAMLRKYRRQIPADLYAVMFPAGEEANGK